MRPVRLLLLTLVVVVLVTGGCLDFGTSTGPRDVDGGDGDDGDELEDGDDTDDSDDHSNDGETDRKTGTLEIHHIDVGQADATLLIEPSGETMLVDSGDWRDDGEQVIAYLEERGIDRVDHLVATHAHADHIGGHAAVIEHVETNGDGVGAIYDSGVVSTSQTYERYLDAVEKHDVDLFPVREGDAVDFGEAEIEFYNPPAEGPNDEDGLNDNSIVLSVAYGDVSYLTTGDAGRTVESRLVERHGDDLRAEVYQAGHHGSSTSSSSAFLDVVDPEVTVVSAPLESQYGHPHDEVLAAFSERGIETYWTGVHGHVVVTTDGESVAVQTERSGPTDGYVLLEEFSTDETETSEQLAQRVTGFPTEVLSLP
ncbi:ComEC/Rec2 family competence protein [Natronosalvus halobius]|uniref:ComEC/Rec2 family competence protein n=1 Tax=Natronosalvus halobius TaxID=2953746 RepID=UPI0020A180C0|nr:ComEC/Rec2 family competence protein [Natronosalvus halobius]USZ70283.1 MBL fold metallo-hydrolase [Natronosalvus halobius]